MKNSNPGNGKRGGGLANRIDKRPRSPVARRSLVAARREQRYAKSGNPPKYFQYAPGSDKAKRDEALMKLRAFMLNCADLLIAVVEGRKKISVTRLRALENAMNRGGLPVMTESKLTAEVPPKMIGTTRAVYVDAEGEHAIEPEGAPEELH